MNVCFIWQTKFASDNEPRWKEHILKTQHTHMHQNITQTKVNFFSCDSNWPQLITLPRRIEAPSSPSISPVLADSGCTSHPQTDLVSDLVNHTSCFFSVFILSEKEIATNTSSPYYIQYIFPGSCGLQLTNLHIRTPCRLWSARRSLPRAVVTQTRNT